MVRPIARFVVDDDVVMELVNRQIKEYEAKGSNYIVEGYPRTRVQAIELQKMKIVPDKFFILNHSEAATFQKLKANMQSNGSGDAGGPKKVLSPEQIEAAAHNAITEYNL